MEGATNRGDAHFLHQKQGVSGGVVALLLLPGWMIAPSGLWTGSRDNQLSFTVCHEIINLHLASAWRTGADGLGEEMQNSEAPGNLSLFAPLCPWLGG